MPTPSFRAPETRDAATVRRDVLASLRALGDSLLAGRRARSVCIAFAGPVDPAGRLLAAPTVLGDGVGAPVPLHGELGALWPEASVLLVNDVTAAGYRYL